jgi:hypothetical protein
MRLRRSVANFFSLAALVNRDFLALRAYKPVALHDVNPE